jgi:hypothetical protein
MSELSGAINLPYAGRILIVDDIYDEKISAAVTSLAQTGLPIQYWDGKGKIPDTIRNVRVVILDLKLDPEMDRDKGLQFYSLAAQALHEIPGPYLVIIMCGDFDAEIDPPNLRKVYEDRFESPIHGYLSSEGLDKEEELAKPESLAELIVKELGGKAVLQLIMLWEHVADRARDLALQDLLSLQVDETIVALIKALCEGIGDESATRELVGIMMRLILRRATEVQQFYCLDTVVRILKVHKPKQAADAQTTTPAPQNLRKIERRLYHNMFFYHPLATERIWTGDIFKTKGNSKYDEYAIVVTPACDLSQGKTTSVTVAFAFPLRENCLKDLEYSPYKTDPPAMKKLKAIREEHIKSGDTTPLTEVPADVLKQVKERFFDPKFRNLPDWFHRFWAFVDQDGDPEPFGICFNFNNVRTVELGAIVPPEWKRVCRLDSPYLEDILLKFGSHSLGIGIPDWDYGDVSESAQTPAS